MQDGTPSLSSLLQRNTAAASHGHTQLRMGVGVLDKDHDEANNRNVKFADSTCPGGSLEDASLGGPQAVT